MSKRVCMDTLQSLAFFTLLATGIAAGQESKVLIRMQRLNAQLETESNAMSSGRNIYAAVNTGSPQDVQNYPNSAACLVVYEDGKYVFEKRDERTIGKPRAKSIEGSLAADDLQRLKAILDDGELKKIEPPKALELPPDTQAIREAERLDVQVFRAGASQHITFMKERIKTGTTNGVASSASLSGMDTYLDNGAPYKKTLNPLVKWFEEVGKKNKLTEAKPQYCQ
jgi:hypothetical protein